MRAIIFRRLSGCIYTWSISSPIASECAAFGASMMNNIAFFRIRFSKCRFHQTTAVTGAVSRQLVQMTAPKAKRAMISGGKSQRLYRLAAMAADKAIVFFLKSFIVHILKYPFKKYDTTRTMRFLLLRKNFIPGT